MLSSGLLPLGKAEKEANKNKIISSIDSVQQRVDEHLALIRDSPEYEGRFNQVVYSLSKDGHFQQNRVEEKKDVVDERGVKFKKQNVAQQIREQQSTPAVTGMIPYGKVFNRNMNDLKTELLHRGVAENDIPETVTARKDILRCLEIDRLIAEGVDQTVAAARKEFKRQSTAAFKLTD